MREVLPARIWHTFDRHNRSKGLADARSAVDFQLIELLEHYATHTGSLFAWLYGMVRGRCGVSTTFFKQATPTTAEELIDEALPVDTSRPIEAPDGSTQELEQLWHGEVDPFAWLETQRARIGETNYEIFLRLAQGRTSAQVGEELGIAASSVRDRVAEVRRRWFGG